MSSKQRKEVDKKSQVVVEKKMDWNVHCEEFVPVKRPTAVVMPVFFHTSNQVNLIVDTNINYEIIKFLHIL